MQSYITSEHPLIGSANQKDLLLRFADPKTAAKEAKIMLWGQFLPVIFVTGLLRVGRVAAHCCAHLNAGTIGFSRKSHLAAFLTL